LEDDDGALESLGGGAGSIRMLVMLR